MTLYARMTALLALVLWHLLPAALYPKASRVQWFGNAYKGSRISPNVAVWHSTETGTWPSYGGGATAPHFTIMADLKRRVIYVRQHFDTNVSARALRNLAGGVETNTLNALQIELVGTCSRDYQRRYGYLYWPDAPQWLLEALADFALWIDGAHPGYKLQDAAPRGWKPYPSSYANGAGQRMSFTEWRGAYGNVGHQHVPENVHGDPGDFDMPRLIAYAKAKAGDNVAPPTPPKVKPLPKPTLVAKARGTLRDAAKAARDQGKARRVRKIKAALQTLPKR